MHHYNAEGLLEAAARSPHVEVEGIYSHFANADAEDLADARRQLERFQEVLRFYERRSLPVPQRHMAGSAALLRLPESHLDLVRPGILLYGVYPYADAPREVVVQPALVLAIPRRLLQGGRGRKSGELRVDLEERPHGPRRHHSRRIWRRLLPQHVEPGPGDPARPALPQVGRICMDQIMVNIEAGTGYNGDEVVLIGEQGGARVTVEELAEWAGTIPYEILTAVSDRVPRLYEP